MERKWLFTPSLKWNTSTWWDGFLVRNTARDDDIGGKMSDMQRVIDREQGRSYSEATVQGAVKKNNVLVFETFWTIDEKIRANIYTTRAKDRSVRQFFHARINYSGEANAYNWSYSRASISISAPGKTIYNIKDEIGRASVGLWTNYDSFRRQR